MNLPKKNTKGQVLFGLDTRARESILYKGILDDEGKLKDSPSYYAVDKTVVAAMQRHAPQVPRQSQKGKGADRKNQETWCCHYCNTTNHTGGWRSCPDR